MFFKTNVLDSLNSFKKKANNLNIENLWLVNKHMKTQHYESLGKYKLKAPWDTTLHPQLYLESVGRWHVLGRMWTQRHLHLLLVGMCNDSVWLFLRMLNSDMPRDPAILLLRSFRRNESICPCRDVRACVDDSIIHSSLKVETTQMSID